MRRRGTQPVARRDIEREIDDFVERQDITIGSSTQGGASTSQVADRGGARNINPPPITADDFEDDSRQTVTGQIEKVEELLKKLQLVKRERQQVLKDLKEKVSHCQFDEHDKILTANRSIPTISAMS